MPVYLICIKLKQVKLVHQTRPVKPETGPRLIVKERDKCVNDHLELGVRSYWSKFTDSS